MPTSLIASAASTPAAELRLPQWFAQLFGRTDLPEGETFAAESGLFSVRDGIPRSHRLPSARQEQTSRVFGFKWNQRETFEGASTAHMRQWLLQKYGDVVCAGWMAEHGEAPVLVDAGCGAAMSGLALFGPALDRIRYVGVDISAAVDVARERFAARSIKAGFIQADLHDIPLPNASVDLIFSEGVLHHCDSTEAAFRAVVRLLRPGGRIMFYVYRKKGPIREFTDDYIRDRLQAMMPQEAWQALYPLTQLGKALGEINVEIEVPEAIALLDIPAGRVNIQRLFYWHVMKAFYRPEMTLDEMNHINFDWYAPRNAHRHTPEEVRGWCAAADLIIEREVIEEAGITIIAKRRAA